MEDNVTADEEDLNEPEENTAPEQEEQDSTPSDTQASLKNASIQSQGLKAQPTGTGSGFADLLSSYKNMYGANNQQLGRANDLYNEAATQDVKPEDLQNLTKASYLDQIRKALAGFTAIGGNLNASQTKTLEDTGNVSPIAEARLRNQSMVADLLRREAKDQMSQASNQMTMQNQQLGGMGDILKLQSQYAPIGPDLAKSMNTQLGFAENTLPPTLNFDQAQKIGQLSMMGMRGQELLAAIGLKDAQIDTARAKQPYIQPTAEANLKSKEAQTNLTDLKGTILPQKFNTDQIKQFNNNTKIGGFDPHAADNALVSYDTALNGLNPQDAQQADMLSRKMIAATAAQFSKGTGKITDLNAALGTLEKYNETPKFNDSQIGQAAEKKYRAALNLAAMGSADLGRGSKFKQQFDLGTAFGGQYLGPGKTLFFGDKTGEVPEEKIQGVRQQVINNISNALRNGITSSVTPDIANEIIKNQYGSYAPLYINKGLQLHNNPNLNQQTGMVESTPQVPTKPPLASPNIKHFSNNIHDYQ